MQVVIDLRAGEQLLPGAGSTLQQLFQQWVIQHPGDQFTWLSHKEADLPAHSNLKIIQVPSLGYKFRTQFRWYERELLPLLGGLKPDWFIPVAGVSIPGLDIPQAAFWLQGPKQHFFENSLISALSYRKMLPSMLKTVKKGWINAEAWAVLEGHSDTLDLTRWQSLAPVAVPDAGSRVNEAAMYDMDYHTGGRPFFASFIAGSQVDATMQLMKSFSVFKKRQQTDWKLLLIGNKGTEYRDLKRAIDSYRYKDDVVLLEATTAEKHTVLNLAYALVQAEGQLLNDQQLLMTLEHATPLLLPDKHPPQNWLGETPVYGASADVSGVAEMMMRIYKDEEFRRGKCQASAALFRRLSLEQLASDSYLNSTADH